MNRRPLSICCKRVIQSSLWGALLLLFNSPALAVELTESLMRDARTTYAYVLNQQYSLQEITRQFPILEQSAKQAEQDFNQSFSIAIDHMDRLMEKKRDWQAIKQGHRRQLDDALNPSLNGMGFEFDQAESYLRQVSERASGKLESPMIETLLLFDPEYRSSPDKEFEDGYIKKYIKRDPQTEKSAVFSIDYPASWVETVADDKRYALRKFVSENGRGSAKVWVLLKDIELPVGERVTKEDIRDLLNPSDQRDMLPKRAKYIKSGLTDIELLPGFWQRFRMKPFKVGKGKKQEGIAYTVYFGNKVLQIQCMVDGDAKMSQKELDNLFKTYEPVFRLMSESIFIPGLYS